MFYDSENYQVHPRTFIPRRIFWPMFFILSLSLVIFVYWHYDRNVWHNSTANYLPPDTHWVVTIPAKETNEQLSEAMKLAQRVPNHGDLLEFDFIKSLSIDAKFINMYEVWQRRKAYLSDEVSLASLPEGYAILARIADKKAVITEVHDEKIHSAPVGDFLVIADSQEVISKISQTKEGQRRVVTKSLKLKKMGQSLFDSAEYKKVSLQLNNSLVSGYISTNVEELPLQMPVKDSVFLRTLQEYIPDFGKRKLKDLFSAEDLPLSFSARVERNGLAIKSRSAKTDASGISRYIASSDMLRSLSIRDTSDISQAVGTLLEVLPGWNISADTDVNDIFVTVNQIDSHKLAQAGKILARLEQDGRRVAGDNSFAIDAAARLADIVIVQSSIAEFQGANGRAPVSLSELVPLYLSAVPVDPASKTGYNYSNERADQSFWISFAFENETHLGPPGLYCLTSQGIESSQTECTEK